MSEPCTAQPLPIQVRVYHRDFLWESGSGLEPAVVEALQGFICREARRMKGLGALRGQNLEDLIQEGRLATLEAARRFDPTRGTEFITYAGFCVRRAILGALRERAVRIPSREHDSLVKAGGLPPVCSLDAATQGGESPLREFLGLDPSQEVDVMQAATRERAWRVLGRLHGRFREVLVRRYGLVREPETLAQIAASWGLSHERVRQIQVLAEARFRNLLTHGIHE